MTSLASDLLISSELTNGADAILKGIFILWALRYLWVETRRRKLTFWHWLNFSLPPSMGFIIAVIISDFASWIRAVVIWIWRRFYSSGDYPLWQTEFLVLAGIIGVVGGLCKVRSVTKPDYGDKLWLLCLAFVIIFIGASLIGRHIF